jgi:dolichol-phosphate mannosyltransferase
LVSIISHSDEYESRKISIVIPCFRVTSNIMGIIEHIGQEVSHVYVVDDCCPDKSGDLVEQNCTDDRVVVLRNEKNIGVGGAVLRGYQAAIDDGADIIVKVDGDGQMDPRLIQQFILPILSGEADYTKGNRFYDIENLKLMPKSRIFGNAVLSFMTKLSSGYWNIFDPTNGYTAIHADVAKHLPFSKISHRYFFETDMLFRLNISRAVVVDVPMKAEYGQEISNLKISNIIGEFIFKHIRNLFKRVFYNYYLRDLSLASIELPVGLVLLFIGVFHGSYSWLHSSQLDTFTPAGTVMLAALPILVGIQLILAFLSYDIASIPKTPRHIRSSKYYFSKRND